MIKQTSSQGLSWQLREQGQGDRTLVFLPGTLGSVDVFERQLEAFSATSRVVLLGYPGSSDLDRLSASFWDILRQLGVEEPHLIGSSLGAFLLQHFTSESTHGARNLVLGNTFVNSHRLRFLRTFDPEFLARSSPAELKKTWLDFVANLGSTALREALLPMVRDQQSDGELHGRSQAIAQLGPVGLSALAPARISLLSCVDDPVCGPAVIEEVEASYPRSQHFRLVTGAHYPHMVNASEYNAAIAQAIA